MASARACILASNMVFLDAMVFRPMTMTYAPACGVLLVMTQRFVMTRNDFIHTVLASLWEKPLFFQAQFTDDEATSAVEQLQAKVELIANTAAKVLPFDGEANATCRRCGKSGANMGRDSHGEYCNDCSLRATFYPKVNP
jgi:hypothetical protein